MTTRTIAVPPWDPFQRIEDWRRSQANPAASRADKIRRVCEGYWRKHGKPEKRQAQAEPAKPAREVGPKEAEALLLAEALRRAKQNQIAEASAPGSHKLPPHVVYGG